MLPAEVGDVVLGQVFGGEDEGQAVLDVLKVGGGHHDALEGVLGGEDDVLVALAGAVEGDVGDLLVLAVDAVGVFGEGVDLDGLAEGVVFPGLGEDGFTGGKFFDDLLGGDAGGWGGVERTEAGWFLWAWVGAWVWGGGSFGGCVRIWDSGEGKGWFGR